MSEVKLRPDFVISDTHWFHENIVRYQSRPSDHDWIMVKKWKSAIKDTNTVLHLGDLFFSKKKGYERFMYEIVPQLTGQKYLILGNHDKKNMDYEALGFTVVKPYQIEYRGFAVSFDHYPRLLHDNEKRIHVHGHIHQNPYSNGEMIRPNNINVSVEAIDYRPAKFTSLLNKAILARNGSKEPYYNSRYQRRKRSQASRKAS